MITPFEVYLILKLDDFVAFFGFLGGLAALVAIVFWATWQDCAGENPDEWHTPEIKLIVARKLAKAPRFLKLARAATLVAAAFIFAATFLPSTKTAAAMLILPKIATEDNAQKLSQEAGDLYGLAKKALEKAVGDGKK